MVASDVDWIYVAQERVMGRCVVNTMTNRSPYMRGMSWLFLRMAVYGRRWSLEVGFVTRILTNSRFISDTQVVTHRKIKTNVVIPKELILYRHKETSVNRLGTGSIIETGNGIG
jgi:hypothetical protein